MDMATRKKVIETRIKVAIKTGNTTEKSFLLDMYNMATELEELKQAEKDGKNE